MAARHVVVVQLAAAAFAVTGIVVVESASEGNVVDLEENPWEVHQERGRRLEDKAFVAGAP